MKQTTLICAFVLLSLSALSETGQAQPEPREAICHKEDEVWKCPRLYHPVCGTDGQSYDNECILCVHNLKTKENVKILYDEKCP